MTTQSRKYRGYASEEIVAQWFRDHGWPYAKAGQRGKGTDVSGMPGLDIEVKARGGFSPLAWLRQVAARKAAAAPLSPRGAVVFRCNGQGPKSVGAWGVLLTLEDFTDMLVELGYQGRSPSV